MPSEREQAIRERAYRLWEQEGCPEGREKAHWAKAEQELDLQGDGGVTTGETASIDAGGGEAPVPQLAAAKPRRTRKAATPADA